MTIREYKKLPLLRSGLCLLLCAVSINSACKRSVEVDLPTSELTTASVFTNDLKATAAMLGIYSRIAGSSFAPGAPQSIALVAGLSSGELQDYSFHTARTEFFLANVSPSNGTNLAIWRTCYQQIYQANAVMEGLATSTGVSTNVKKQLQGEALFMRAFLHFYLVNLWGTIPFISGTDYRNNARVTRLPVAEVYKNIIADLRLATDLLPEMYTDADRSRPNKYTAMAMLARVYLYTNDWISAEQLATGVIDQTGAYQLLPDVAHVFERNSMETIWQLFPVFPNYNATEGYYYILIDAPAYAAIPDDFLQVFEPGDLRKDNWIGAYNGATQTFYYPSKYKVRYAADVTECSVVIRLAELYLIRAEARAMQDKLTGKGSATEDIDQIRNRAGLPGSGALTRQEMLMAIEQERQTELFTEWGHRWFDLKRTGRADAVLGLLKTPNWQPTDALYPVPLPELLNNNQLTQNSGY